MSTPSRSGHIKLVMGPMFSGKTTELMRLAKRYRLADPDCKVLIVSHESDTRYKPEVEKEENLSASYESVGTRSAVTSHEGRSMPAVAVESLRQIIPIADEYDVIAVDEGQFYSDLAEECDLLAENGKIVIVAALDGTYKREPFPQVSLLISKADYIEKLQAICHFCRSEASFTHRIVASDSEVLVGGKESYIPLCRSCFHQHYD